MVAVQHSIGAVQNLVQFVHRLCFGLNISDLEANFAAVPGMEPSTDHRRQKNEERSNSGNETDGEL